MQLKLNAKFVTQKEYGGPFCNFLLYKQKGSPYWPPDAGVFCKMQCPLAKFITITELPVIEVRIGTPGGKEYGNSKHCVNIVNHSLH
jgi:hypothetical protein